MFFFKSFFSVLSSRERTKAPGTSFASRSRLLLVSYHVTSLIRLLLAACVCRSNLGNKRTRFTHSQHRMAHTLRHFCSNSSIGTDTRCCSTPCRFCLKITLIRANFKSVKHQHLFYTRKGQGFLLAQFVLFMPFGSLFIGRADPAPTVSLIVIDNTRCSHPAGHD